MASGLVGQAPCSYRLIQHTENRIYFPLSQGRVCFYIVPPPGIEPGSRVPQTRILSVELRGRFAVPAPHYHETAKV